MKTFKSKITLSKNSRGCYILDTVKGCSIVNAVPRGCYDDCYAQNIASRYGFDFGKTVKRGLDDPSTEQPSLFGFEDDTHLSELLRQIKKIEMPFVRIGEMGDPSWDWKHTLGIVEKIKPAGKPIVIITKHWTVIPDSMLGMLSGVCINTSVSALDSTEDMAARVWQYERLKPYCKSVLRVVSCEFNEDNPEGLERAKVQRFLLSRENSLDTIFRPSPSNQFVTSGVIKTRKAKFLKSEVLASVHDSKTYFGHCSTCPDMCGVTSWEPDTDIDETGFQPMEELDPHRPAMARK